jgi:hypothetical protein
MNNKLVILILIIVIIYSYSKARKLPFDMNVIGIVLILGFFFLSLGMIIIYSSHDFEYLINCMLFKQFSFASIFIINGYALTAGSLLMLIETFIKKNSQRL